MSVVDPTTFETVVPSRHITFTFPNPFSEPFPSVLDMPLIRVFVIDSPVATADATGRVAAMLVPANRDSDWTFSTEAGHLQLLLTFPGLSRLILIARNSSHCCNPRSYKPPLTTTGTNQSEIEDKLVPLMLALTPKLAFVQNNGFPEIPFLSYEDEVIRSSVLEVCVGHCVGEMLIENVELKLVDGGREFRRRLRFKRMPNLVQSQVRIYLDNESDLGDELEDVEFLVDTGVLVQPYLSPMVAGISLICSHLDGRIQEGIRPKALCLGVGGGALVSFLSVQLGFEVVAVEADQVVLSVAKEYFGLRESEMVNLCAGDGIDLLERNEFSGKDLNFGKKFDVIMVDLDSSDARIGTSAPPLEFVRKSVLLGAREIISRNGVLIINVIPPNKPFYETVVTKFQQVFEELYEIDVGNGENMVLVASGSRIQSTTSDHENHFLQKLRACIPESSMDSIKKISKSAIDD